MTTEREDLGTHVELCQLRYEATQAKMNRIENHIDKLEKDIDNLKVESAKNFNEIKDMIQRGQNQKYTAIVASAGSIIVALIGLLGYLITHLAT